MKCVPRLLPLALLLSIGAPLSGVPLPQAEAEEPVVGARHPALRLPTIDGKQTIDLRALTGELTGKKVLLIQFASW